MLRFLKLLRDAPDAVKADEFYRGIREVDPDTFHIVCAHRVAELTGQPIFWIGYQKVYSYVTVSTDFLASDFGSLVYKVSNNPEQFDTAAAIAAAFEKAEELDRDVTEYYVFLSEVAELASLANRHVYDRRTAERFSKREDVGAVVARIKSRFPKWVEAAPVCRSSE